MACRVSMLCCFVFLACSQFLRARSVPAPVPLPVPLKAMPVHAITMYGDKPKYPPDFKHFDYVNPKAPKGGTITTNERGRFDSFNPYLIKGDPAKNISLIYDTLLEWSADEPYTAYGLLAKSIELPDDRSWIAFNLRPQARFNDQRPVTADDVIFSYQQLLEHGPPSLKNNLQEIRSVSKTSDHRVLFTFKHPNQRKLPFFIGQITVFPKHFWESGKHDFSKADFDIPLGSGPYQIDSFKPGTKVVLRRSKNYWGKDLPINIGRYNVDFYNTEYYRDDLLAFEAFKAGGYNLRFENSSTKWYTGYDFPAVKKGDVIRERIPVKITMGMKSFAFNLRRPPMDDIRVREALTLAFDFEWLNKHMMNNEYTRCSTYFTTQDFAATGLPSEGELKLLDPYRNQLPKKLFTNVYQPPTTDGSGDDLNHLHQAVALLQDAGWELKDAIMVNAKTGEPLKLTLTSPFSDHTRFIMPYVKNLEKIGVTVTLNTINMTQYTHLISNFEFDMVEWAYGFERAPGPELENIFGSKAADRVGSQNIIGIKNPVVDHLIALTGTVKHWQQLVITLKALDRVLLWNHYVVPKWYMARGWCLAHCKELKHPGIDNLNWLEMSTWWYQP